jgi:hypothetical protein
MLAKGREARGQGTAQATMSMAVTPDGEGSRVSVSTDLQITGRVAQMGKGIMQDVATRMIGDMARCMEQRLAGEPPAAETEPASPAPPVGSATAEGAPPRAAAPPSPEPVAPIGGLSLVGPVLLRRLRPVLPLLGGLVVVLVLLRRRAR